MASCSLATVLTFAVVMAVAISVADCKKLKGESKGRGFRPRAEVSRGLSDSDRARWPLFLTTFHPEAKRFRSLLNKSLNRVERRRTRRLRQFDPAAWKRTKNSFNSIREATKSKKTRPSEPRTAALESPSISDKFPPPQKRPNVILMIADDQDVELGSLQFMPKLKKHLKEKGAHMENGFVTTPMCCPSRSSMLTGLYAHNHNVLTNNDNCSSAYWVENHEPRTFATYMRDSGYKTGYFGKYLNKYAGNHIPQGWDEWSGLVRNSKFYNYSLNVNGEKIRHGWDYEKDYFPDVITNSSLDFFREAKRRRPSQPVLMVMSYPGPHGPEDSAPQYQDLFFNVTTHHTPAYDYAPNPDKQWILQVTERMEPIHKKFTDVLMTKRLQTLQSIDDSIERLCTELESLGELDNTYIFYTSDHGYHLGQFGLVKGKAFPFDVDIKVPFFVRGPKIGPGAVKREPALNIDLAPTFLDIAGVSAPLHMDGKSLLPTLFSHEELSASGKMRKKEWRDSFLVERGKMTAERYAQIRPNLPPEASKTNRWSSSDEGFSFPTGGGWSLLLEKPRVTKQERLAADCLKPRLRGPCRMFQRRKCVRKNNGDWKLVSCKSHADNYFADRAEQDQGCVCDDFSNETEARTERRLQKDFLKKHLTASRDRQQRKMRRHRFLDLDAAADEFRSKRSLTSSSSRQEPEPPVAAALDAIAEEEIDQVDIIMEDISDEIQDLQLSIVNSTAGKPYHKLNDGPSCQLSNNCSGQALTWRASRSYVNEQIRRLRAQLFELKEIRKHLKKKQPRVEKEKSISRRIAKCFCGDRTSQNQLRRQMQQRRKVKRDKAKAERRLQRKEKRQLKKAKKLRKERRRKSQEHCVVKNDTKLNCFSHDDNHWKTEPKWNDGSFCACTNSNFNTYWCVRTVNVTHNYLYCEFVSGIITYYDLNVDPYQLRNIYQTLADDELNYMHRQLLGLKDYSGFDGRWRPAKVLDGRRSLSGRASSAANRRSKKRKSRQRKFINLYGRMLPPPEAYNFRKHSKDAGNGQHPQ